MRAFATIIIIGILIPLSVEAQLFRKHKKPANDSLRSGKYCEFWDSDSSTISVKGNYDKGLACKTWKYYYSDGTLRMKVKYRDNLKIKYYTLSGKLDQKGYAVLDLNAKQIHFYWHGRWKYFDDRRKLYRIAQYENGVEVKVLYGPEDPIYFE
jgi:antitoxin component YwqK of YwqJK toxin-antitoxin module